MRAVIVALLLCGCTSVQDGRGFDDEFMDTGGGFKFTDCTVVEPNIVAFTAEIREPRTVHVRLSTTCEEPHLIQLMGLTLDDPYEGFSVPVIDEPLESQTQEGIPVEIRFTATEPRAYEAQLVVLVSGAFEPTTHTVQLSAELPAP